jgi:hypothetical protein
MARGKKAELPSQGRAGMSMARAERLVAKTQTRANKSSRVFVALGLATVAGMTAYGVLGAKGNGPAQGMQAYAASEPDVAIAPVPATVEMSAQPTLPAGTAEVEATLAMVRDADLAGADVPVDAIPETSPPAPAENTIASAECVDVIEGLLVSLRTSAAADGSWTTQQDGLTRLVQATLDCEGAGFRIAGSLELVGSGIADLKVHWDREGKVLDLAMIDRTEGSVVEEAAVLDDTSIQFVIR